MSDITAIKRIHNLAAGIVQVINRERGAAVPPFAGPGVREVDWAIPWAWAETHFTNDNRHIDVIAPGFTCSIWQQDADVVSTPDGTFTGPRTRLGDIRGDRQLLILPTGPRPCSRRPSPSRRAQASSASGVRSACATTRWPGAWDTPVRESS